MSGIWRLKVCSEFSAAHSLRNYQGKCENLHGHNFTAEICVQGSRLEEDTEMLIDFKILKNILKEILENLDHKLLNGTPPFDHTNPTSENLARHIFESVAKALGDASSARIISATVCERPGQCATYLEDMY